MEQYYCKKCGREMVQEGKKLIGVETTYIGTRLRYEIFLTCPERLKPFGWLKWSHDQLKVTSDD